MRPLQRQLVFELRVASRGAPGASLAAPAGLRLESGVHGARKESPVPPGGCRSDDGVDGLRQTALTVAVYRRAKVSICGACR